MTPLKFAVLVSMPRPVLSLFSRLDVKCAVAPKTELEGRPRGALPSASLVVDGFPSAAPSFSVELHVDLSHAGQGLPESS
jgi:hypothetical protein